MTAKEDICNWLARGIEENFQFMFVVCDTFDYEDYPVYAKDAEHFDKEFDHYNGKNMQKIMEIYNLNLDIATQANEFRAWNFPLQSKFGFADIKAVF